MTFIMGDTLAGSIDSLPRGLKAYASYVDGYGGFGELLQKRGGAGVTCLSISVNYNRARCGDFESGALAPWQAAGFLDHLAEPHPVLYAAAGTLQAVLDSAGNRSAQVWSAHVGQGEHICGPPGAGYPGNPGCQYRFSKPVNATQWVWNPGGANIDLSVCADDFLHVGPPPPPPDPFGYLRFTNDKYDGPFGWIRERDVVLHYDGARKHPFLHRRLLDHDLRPKLHYLADRVFAVAHRDAHHDGSPSWEKFDRGWRYQGLRHRADGGRVVP